MEHLSLEEKETSITFDETPGMASVFTYNKRWQRRIEGFGIKPISNNGFGGKEYAVPKKCIRLYPPGRPKG